MKWTLAFIVMAQPAFAQTCPPVTDQSVAIATIITQLQATEGPEVARPLTAQLWTIWRKAPDAQAQQLLDRGSAQILDSDYRGARRTFDTLVAYCPDYAEGYNQRAFASYIMRDYAAALADLDKTIALVPNHVAAMAGKGLSLLALDRDAEAQIVLKDAVALHPWLEERRLITQPAGTDL